MLFDVLSPTLLVVADLILLFPYLYEMVTLCCASTVIVAVACVVEVRVGQPFA